MKRHEIDSTDVCSYLETLLWSETANADLEIEGETYEEGTPLDQVPGCDVSDLETLAPKILTEAEEDLKDFQSYCLKSLGFDPFTLFDPEQVCHDFALSRNGHGAGFFDDPYEVTTRGPNGYEAQHGFSDALQSAAKTFGTYGLDVWTDEEGNLHMESHS